MDFKTFFQSLTKEDRERFAAIAGAELSYIKTHLIYRRKIPQPDLMDGLVAALYEFKSGITRQDLLHFFYPPKSFEETAVKPRSPGRRKTDLVSGRRNVGTSK